MELALFTGGNRTFIGIKNKNNTLEIKSFESKILFQDPNLFHERFLLLLGRRFGIHDYKDIQKITLAISGLINPNTKTIVSSYNLDEIAVTKRYAGFSFAEGFRKYTEAEVNVINDAYAIAVGVNALYPKLFPAIVLQIETGVGVSVINSKGTIIPTELGGDFVPGFERKTAHYLLGQDGIDELLREGSLDVYSDITGNLLKAITFFCDASKEMLYINGESTELPINVFIWTDKEEYIDKEILGNSGEIKVYFPKDTLEWELLPVTGCFEYTNYLNKCVKDIKNIDFYSIKGSFICGFESFRDFSSHWKTVKSFADQESEYRINYHDSSLKVVKMRDLNHEFELRAYKF